MRQGKIVVVGAGMVGGSAALFSAVAVPSAQILMVDVERVRAEGQVLDLAHASAFWGHDRFAAGDYADALDADIVVLTAGAGVKPGQTRLDLALTNARIAVAIVDELAPRAPGATWVVAANPCDVLAQVVRERLGCAPERVISTGTSLDTARLRSLLSQRLGVVSPAIEAYVIGEHGESALINWSAASVAGMPLSAFLEQAGREMSRTTRDLVLRSVVEAAKQIKEGKGATHYGIGSAIGRICQAIAHNSHLVMSVATVQAEVEGIPEVCVSLPMVIDGAGAHLVAYPRLDQEERAALRLSAQAVKEAAAGVLSAL